MVAKSPNTSLKASKTTKSLPKSSQRSKKQTDEQRHTNSSFKGKIPLGPLVHYGPLLLREKLASKTPATMRSSDQKFIFSAKKGRPGGPLQVKSSNMNARPISQGMAGSSPYQEANSSKRNTQQAPLKTQKK